VGDKRQFEKSKRLFLVIEVLYIIYLYSDYSLVPFSLFNLVRSGLSDKVSAD